MKNYLIALTLLLFEISSYVHSVPDAVATDPKDVYQVLEDPDSITFVNPQHNRNILRDIVYYYLIESAFDEEDSSVTERPFTNGHGLPILEETTENKTGHSRTKRDADIQKIPEAPSIPAIHYDSFPPYVRRLVSTERPDESDNYGQSPTMQSRLTVPIMMRSAPEARTYGMRLTPGGTYVWNDLLKPREDFPRNYGDANKKDEFIGPRIDIRYDNTEKTTKHGEKEDINYNKHKEIEKLIEQRMKHILATLKPVYFVNEDTSELEKEAKERDDKQAEANAKDENPAEESIEKDEETLIEEDEELPRTYGMKLLNGRGYIWNDIFTNPGVSYDVGEQKDPNEIDMTKEPTLELPGRPIALSSTDEDGKPIEMVSSTNEDENFDDEYENKEEMDDIFAQIAKYKQTTPSPILHITFQKNQNKNNDEESNVGNNFTDSEELMLNEQFWTWVSQWTQMLMDIMTKYTKKSVEAEVKKQLRFNLKILKEDAYKLHTKDKDRRYGYDGQDIPDTPIDAEKDEIELAKHKENNEFILIKDDKLIVDGIEIPLTHHSYLEIKKENPRKEKYINTDRVKRRKKKPSSDKDNSIEKRNKTEVNDKDNEQNNKKNHTEYKVQVENVYGNAVNSDKVTNIFIFHSDKGTDQIVEELKPIFGENGVPTIKPDDDKNGEKQESKEPNEAINKEDSTEKIDSQASNEDGPNRGDTSDQDKSTEKPSGEEQETFIDTDKTGESNVEEENPGENRDPNESENIEEDKNSAINQGTTESDKNTAINLNAEREESNAENI